MCCSLARHDVNKMVEEWRDPRDRHKTLRIDVHTHILPERWPDLKERYGYGGWVKLEHTSCKGKARMFRGACLPFFVAGGTSVSRLPRSADDGTPFRDVEENCWSLKRRIFDCDKRGVDVHVLSTVPIMFSYWAKPEVRRAGYTSPRAIDTRSRYAARLGSIDDAQ